MVCELWPALLLFAVSSMYPVHCVSKPTTQLHHPPTHHPPTNPITVPPICLETKSLRPSSLPGSLFRTGHDGMLSQCKLGSVRSKPRCSMPSIQSNHQPHIWCQSSLPRNSSQDIWFVLSMDSGLLDQLQQRGWFRPSATWSLKSVCWTRREAGLCTRRDSVGD